MSQSATCPECGSRLLAEAAEGLCPYCLIQTALNPPPVSDEEFGRCPSEEQLRWLAEGSLPEPDANSVREHVEVCPSCQIRSDALRDPADLGVSRLDSGPTVVEPSDNAFPPLTSLKEPTVSTPSNHLPDDSIPGYQILKEIHRGGQGVVYQAIQKSTKRRVAIKVMREGPFAGPHDRSRFEREVQILAALQHPHIVSVLDSGSASGNFYFTMDYISGDALDRYVELRNLSVNDILRLFAKVCEAVNAAHLHGVIHRDLKPANIRVDTEGEPHVLDFGLARVASGGLTADSRPQMMTMTGDFVGSPPWAAPEQAEGLPHLIDVRTDVYALGVILFQILTGRFPYDVTGNILDVLERVRDAEPVKPSTLRPGIGDEVETIILKCLTKDRERRYQSAGELARDIHHYLNGEPIEAKRDSTMYVLRKALRRYRIPVAVATAFVVLIIVSLVVSVSLWYRAQQNFHTAEMALDLAGAKTHEAEASAREARRRLYSNQMTLAQQALETNSSSLKGLLDGCPREFRGWEWYRLKRLADRSRMTITVHTGAVHCVAFSPDGRWVASAGVGPMLSFWESRTGRILREIDEPNGFLRSVAFSCTGDRIAFCGGAWQTVELWEVSSWQTALTLPLRSQSVAFATDGSRVATSNGKGNISIFSANTGEEVQTLSGHTGGIVRLKYSANGRWLASASGDGTVRIWDARTGESLHILRDSEGKVYDIAFSPDSQLLASAGEAGAVRLWDLDAGIEVLALRGHTLAINSVTFSPDGLRLCSGGRDGTLRLWDATTGDQLSVLRGHSRAVVCVAFSPDGQSLVSAAKEPEIKLWDSVPVADERTVLVPENATNVVFSGNSEQLLAIVEGEVCVWDAASGKRLELTGNEFHPDIYTSDQRHRMRIDAIGELHVEDVATGQLVVVQHAEYRIQYAQFCPDGRTMATFCGCGLLHIWDVGSGKLLRSSQTNIVNPQTMPFDYSSDGERIATCSRNATVCLWDAETLKPLLQPLEHPNNVQGVAFSPDDSRIVTVGTDVRIWDAKGGEMLAAFGESHDGVYVQVAFSPNGRSIAATTIRNATGTRIIKVWESADPREFTVPTALIDTP